MVTKGKWEVKKLPITGGLAIYSGHELIAGGLFDEDANVIVTAINACTGINPDNPQAVSESISDFYEALKGLASCFRNIEILSSIQDDEERHILGIAVDTMTKALTKTECKK